MDNRPLRITTDDTQEVVPTSPLGVPIGQKLFRVKIRVSSVGAQRSGMHHTKFPELILTEQTMAESGLIALAAQKAGVAYLPPRPKESNER